MNILLVGNGFDLHHKFPTRYLDFLHVINFLVEKENSTFNTVGDVLGNKELQEKDPFIGECYEVHSHIYDSTRLPDGFVCDIVKRAKENMWFNYFSSCVTKDIQWIDFEKEILRVLEVFHFLFEIEILQASHPNNRITFDLARELWSVARYILLKFNFFADKVSSTKMGNPQEMRMKSKYIKETISGAGVFRVSTENIIADLYISFQDFSNILRDFLLVFIDAPSAECVRHGNEPYFACLPEINHVYSFNYTNTIERFYGNVGIDHIHGNVGSNIVLGINPNEDDELETIDTTFLQFKKYFQRAFFKTDISFLRHVKGPRRSRTLYVIGHSLNSTDEDLLRKIFELADVIYIFYHEERVVKDQISNLVEIYGKEGFDLLRLEKKLQFWPQSEIQWRSNKGN